MSVMIWITSEPTNTKQLNIVNNEINVHVEYRLHTILKYCTLNMNVALLLEKEAYFYCFRKNQKNSLIRNSVHVVSEDFFCQQHLVCNSYFELSYMFCLQFKW